MKHLSRPGFDYPPAHVMEFENRVRGRVEWPGYPGMTLWRGLARMHCRCGWRSFWMVWGGRTVAEMVANGRRIEAVAVRHREEARQFYLERHPEAREA